MVALHGLSWHDESGGHDACCDFARPVRRTRPGRFSWVVSSLRSPDCSGVRERWNQASQNAAESRRIEALHSARDDYRLLLTGHIRLLEDYLALATFTESFLELIRCGWKS